MREHRPICPAVVPDRDPPSGVIVPALKAMLGALLFSVVLLALLLILAELAFCLRFGS